jgi:6-phosphogluconolactonase
MLLASSAHFNLQNQKDFSMKRIKFLCCLTFLSASFSLPFLVEKVAANNPEESQGFVYTMTNAPTGNQILSFRRSANGLLSGSTAFNTDGLGTGTGLGNQNALVLDQANSCLYAVNAGSNDISSFAVLSDSLRFVNKISSGGSRPVSIAVHGNLLYALNAGGAVGASDNISGFTVDRNCQISSLAQSIRPLSAANTAPAQVQFTPDGKILIVTEKATNKINTYLVAADGKASGPNVQDSVGVTPFGFAIGKRHQLFISEANGGTAEASSVSSYLIKPDGKLDVISAKVPTQESAACWVVVSNDGRIAYVTNTGSQSISGFDVNFNGKLELLNSDGITGKTAPGTAPVDLILSNDGRNLYTLDNRLGSIATFRVNIATGQILPIQTVTGLPVGANGLAAR